MRNETGSPASALFRYAAPQGPDTVGYALVSDRFVCALATPAPHEMLLALWEILHDDASQFEDILTYFARNGIAALPSFALAQLVDTATGSVLLAVRGSGRIELNSPGSSSYVGAGATTWVEGSAKSVTGMVVGLGPLDAGVSTLPLLRGVVASTQVAWGEALGSAAADATSATEAEKEPDLSDLPDWALPTYNDSDITFTRNVAAALPPTPSAAMPGQVLEAASEPDTVDDDEKTVYVRGNRTQPQPELDEDADKTVMLAHRSKRAPRTAAPRLGLPDGTTADLDAPVIVGRKPRVQPGTDVVPRLVTVASPTSEVSGNHVEFSAVDGGVRVRDLNSTNGSIVRSPGQESFVLAAGESITALAGTDVDIGDGNIVTVVS